MNAESTPILLSLEAESTLEGASEDAMRLMTTGELYEREGVIVIRYEEAVDETEAPQQIELTIDGQTITMNRTGAYSSKMVFEKGKRFESLYETPYGVMNMAIYCTRALHKRTALGGDMNLKYQLDMGGQFVGEHHLVIHYLFKQDA